MNWILTCMFPCVRKLPCSLIHDRGFSVGRTSPSASPGVPVVFTSAFWRLPVWSHLRHFPRHSPMLLSSLTPHVVCSCPVEVMSYPLRLSHQSCECHCCQCHGVSHRGYWAAWGKKPTFHQCPRDIYSLSSPAHIGTCSPGVPLTWPPQSPWARGEVLGSS